MARNAAFDERMISIATRFARETAGVIAREQVSAIIAMTNRNVREEVANGIQDAINEMNFSEETKAMIFSSIENVVSKCIENALVTDEQREAVRHHD